MPHNNATLKLNITVSVGVSRTGKTGVVFVEPGAKVNVQSINEKVFGKGYCICARCANCRWTLQQYGAPSHTHGAISAINAKMSFIEQNMTL